MEKSAYELLRMCEILLMRLIAGHHQRSYIDALTMPAGMIEEIRALHFQVCEACIKEQNKEKKRNRTTQHKNK
jgi:hypothetical protein